MANGETEDVLEPRRVGPAGRSFAVGVAVVAALGVMLYLVTGTDDRAGRSDAARESRAEAFPRLEVTTTTAGSVRTTPTTATPRSYSTNVTTSVSETATIGSLPHADYSWQQVALDGPGSMGAMWLGEFDGAIVVLCPAWDEGGTERLVTYRSTDGVSWDTLGSQDLPDNAFISYAVSDGERLYVFAEVWDGDYVGGEVLLYATSDGAAWTQQPLDLGAEENEVVYIQSVAAGPAGLAVAATFETYTDPAIVLDFGDTQVKLDHRAGSYQLIDSATTDVLLSGPIEALLPGNSSDGQRIYDPETGDVLVTIPQHLWDAGFSNAGSGGSPLPIPVYPRDSGGVASIEYDGFEVIVSEIDGTYEVADAATGAVISSGTLEDLYNGPPPHLVAPETGEVLLDATWDEWFAAQGEAYGAVAANPGDYTSRTELLTSRAGDPWEETAVPGEYGNNVSALVATESGFMAWVQSFDESGEQWSIWTMEDGAWSSQTADYGDVWFEGVARVSAGLIGFGYGQNGSEIWSSPDGSEWTSEFSFGSQGGGFYDYVADLATNAEGAVAVLAAHEAWPEYRPLVLDEDGYTLRFGEGEPALTVTDATSGSLVLSLGWETFDNGRASGIVTWDDGVTSIDLGNGEILAISDDEAQAAIDDQWAGPDREVSILLEEDGRWIAATIPGNADLANAGRVLPVDGRIVIVAPGPVAENAAGGEGPEVTGLVVLVGTPG